MTEFSLSSLALRELTSAECKRVMQCRCSHEIIEWETNKFTFIFCEYNLAIMRTGSLGGDVRDIHGGWKYLTVDHMRKEWREIGEVAKTFKRGEK